MKIELTIWDNRLAKDEKYEILLYCERTMCKLWRSWKNGPTEVRTSWTSSSITMRVWWESWQISKPDFLRMYNRKLCKLHYWNREDEPLVMTWNLSEG